MACCARSAEQVEATAAELSGIGGRARGFRLDVTRRNEIDTVVADVGAALGPIDILVNNAGITLDKGTVDVTDEEWDDVLATNLTSMFKLARAVVPGMIEQRRGKIINIGSMYGKIGVPRYAAYCASKAAVEALTRSLAVEWARHGIRVNCLAPGYVNTDIPREAMADREAPDALSVPGPGPPDRRAGGGRHARRLPGLGGLGLHDRANRLFWTGATTIAW